MQHNTWILTEKGSASIVVLTESELSVVTFVGYNASTKAEEAEGELAEGRDPDSFRNTTLASIAYPDVSKMVVQEQGTYLDIEARAGVDGVSLQAGYHEEALEIARAVAEKMDAIESQEPISVSDALMLPGIAAGLSLLFGLAMFWSASGHSSDRAVVRPGRHLTAEGMSGIAETLGPTGVAVVAVGALIACAAWGYHRVEDRPLQTVWIHS